jgi:hypothetical protein
VFYQGSACRTSSKLFYTKQKDQPHFYFVCSLGALRARVLVKVIVALARMFLLMLRAIFPPQTVQLH